MASQRQKIYEVQPDFQGTSWGEALDKVFGLERDIAILAKKSGATVYFHRLQNPVTGAPAVLLECSGEFLDKVKKLPAFASVRELPPGIETFRASDAPQVEPPEAQSPSVKPPKPKGPGI